MRGRPRAVRISIDKAHLGVLTGQWGAAVTLQRLCLMHRRIIFKLGVSIVVGVAVILFYLVNIPEDRSRSGGRAYRKLVLESSPDLLSPHLHHELSRRSDQEVLNKHAEAVRIHTQISARSARDAHETNEDQNPPPGRAKIKDGLFEDDLGSTAEKLKKEPIHLLGGFPQEVAEDAKKVVNHKKSSKDDELAHSRKVDHSLLNQTSKEHDFRFESEHLNANIKKLRNSATLGSPPVHLCVVVCGTRSQETITMLKSAILVTPLNVSLVFHIFAEPEIQKFIQNQLDLWPSVQRQRLSYHIYNVTFPDSSTTNAWKKLFKPCASQRLFLPNLLRSVRRLIYVDTDTVFLESLAHLWALFDDFNSTQLAGLVGEAEAGFAAWYNRFANHPFYGKFGLNSGVMLMDLDRLRETSWLSDMQRLFHQYRLSLPWGDQDLINIYFAFHPDQMYLMPCRWNYRNDHCRYNSNCVSAEQDGIAVLHGSRRTFESNKEPLFKIIHRAFAKYEFGDDIEFKFLKNLEEDIQAEKHKTSNCWKVTSIFMLQLHSLRDRNEEFIQASRKKQGTPKKPPKAVISAGDKPAHSAQHMRVEEKPEESSEGKKKLADHAAPRERDNSRAHLHKEKPPATKERVKKEAVHAQTSEEEELRERLEKTPVKPREEGKNVVRQDGEKKKQVQRTKQVVSHHIDLQEDSLEDSNVDVSLVKQLKSSSQRREAVKSDVKERPGNAVVEKMFVSDKDEDIDKEQGARELNPKQEKLSSLSNSQARHHENDNVDDSKASSIKNHENVGESKAIQARNHENEDIRNHGKIIQARNQENENVRVDKAVHVRNHENDRDSKVFHALRNHENKDESEVIQVRNHENVRVDEAVHVRNHENVDASETIKSKYPDGKANHARNHDNEKETIPKNSALKFERRIDEKALNEDTEDERREHRH